MRSILSDHTPNWCLSHSRASSATLVHALYKASAWALNLTHHLRNLRKLDSALDSQYPLRSIRDVRVLDM